MSGYRDGRGMLAQGRVGVRRLGAREYPEPVRGLSVSVRGYAPVRGSSAQSLSNGDTTARRHAP